MARRTADLDKALGIVGIVLGVLVLIGRLSFGWIADLAGIVLIVVGFLILFRVLRGTTFKGVVFLAFGLFLALDVFGIPRAFTRIVDIVVGILLLLYGIFLLK